MCPTASITLACLITFYHFQSCQWPWTVPTAQAFSICENFQWGAVYNDFLQQAQQQWCPGHFLSPKIGGRSSDNKCAATSPEANSSSPFWWIFMWETVVRNEDLRNEYSEMTSSLSQSSATFNKLQTEEPLSFLQLGVCRYVCNYELGLWGWSCGRNADFPQLFTWLTPFRLGVSSSIAFPDVFLLSYQKHAVCHTLNSTLFTSYRHLSMG